VRSLAIALIVPDIRRPAQVELEVTLRPEDHSGLRLATFAALIPIMRAEVDGLDVATCLRGISPHPIVDLLKIVDAHEAAANPRLVRDDDDPEARV
jgi:hypothetical protein